ncbi:hypothetical protein JJC03_09370 [Flavobacterium oreochromis]|uniref:hypothetical protein n=1 Tax=Flavobacterium oreochromis TaxID=2906078 RepID=UPI001CE5A9AB|nr:hypothetical protein [Flavobacterium oreochromis]QYS85447.1 hypothetical protein JJC03_09370 [Flavobacterium oreochromis]
MTKIQILQQLVHTQVSNDKSKDLLGKIIRKEFDATDNEQKAFELLTIAFRWKLPQFNEMIDDYEFSDLNWF